MAMTINHLHERVEIKLRYFFRFNQNSTDEEAGEYLRQVTWDEAPDTVTDLLWVLHSEPGLLHETPEIDGTFFQMLNCQIADELYDTAARQFEAWREEEAEITDDEEEEAEDE